MLHWPGWDDDTCRMIWKTASTLREFFFVILQQTATDGIRRYIQRIYTQLPPQAVCALFVSAYLSIAVSGAEESLQSSRGREHLVFARSQSRCVSVLSGDFTWRAEVQDHSVVTNNQQVILKWVTLDQVPYLLLFNPLYDHSTAPAWRWIDTVMISNVMCKLNINTC